MRELALFAGAGGGLLGSHLLGWTTTCAVEIDPYARNVLLARQRDGHLPRFPIWDDVRTFDGRPWKGSVDVVSGGFPCQPFSSAAAGNNVAEDLWPEMLRIIREVQPAHVFAENVKRKPIEQAARDLSALGYACQAIELSAADVGAPHRRQRFWLRGDTNGHSESVRPKHAKMEGVQAPTRRLWSPGSLRGLRMADGVAGRMDRPRAAGNGQVPAVAALAWSVLST